jgi:hypothetical protein
MIAFPHEFNAEFGVLTVKSVLEAKVWVSGCDSLVYIWHVDSRSSRVNDVFLLGQKHR